MKSFIRGCYSVVVQRDPQTSIALFLLKSVYYHLLSKQIFAHHNTTILGLRNIQTHGQLFVGTSYVGFLNKYDRTFLNINGELIIEGNVNVGKGCRFDVCTGAICVLRQCSITGQSNFIVANRLTIGEGSVISWGCEISDSDWHNIDYQGKRERDQAIVIGSHVWIGSHVKILKGVHIGNNPVVAANSVVTKSFGEENILIAGNPAMIIKRGVEWH